MSDLEIVKEDGAQRGRYVARPAGTDAEVELTFRHHGPGVISADHTGVPDAMGGHGVAKALLAFMLDDAGSAGLRIIPLCPFVRGQYAKHPEWAELFTTKPGEDPLGGDHGKGRKLGPVPQGFASGLPVTVCPVERGQDQVKQGPAGQAPAERLAEKPLM